MAETLIAQEITISVDDWAWDDQMGYTATIEKQFSFTEGETYRIVCNGTSNEASTACNISELVGFDMVAVGDMKVLGLPANTGKYILGDGGTYNMFVLTSAPQSITPGNYTFSIYHVVEGEEPETPPDEETPTGSTIVLRDRNGNPVEYPGIDRIKLNTAEGGIQNFGAYDPATLTPDKLAEGVTVGDVTGTLSVPVSVVKDVTQDELNFSGGTIALTPDTGKVFSGVNIPVPDNLVPGNIAEGVNIAGIVGALAGGGSNVKIAFGTVSTQQTSKYTITHNLGVVPDIVYYQSALTSQYGICVLGVGVSTAFGDLVGKKYNVRVITNSSGKMFVDSYTRGIDYAAITIPILNANQTTVDIACDSTYKIMSGSTWFAIGGLT